MPNTPQHGIPYPLGSDAPNAPAQLQALATVVDDQLPSVSTNQPAPLPGLIWRDPNSGEVWISDGATWFPVTRRMVQIGNATLDLSTPDTNVTVAVSFPVPFASGQNPVVVATAANAPPVAAGSTHALWTTALSPTGFTIGARRSGGVLASFIARWVAVGLAPPI